MSFHFKILLSLLLLLLFRWSLYFIDFDWWFTYDWWVTLQYSLVYRHYCFSLMMAYYGYCTTSSERRLLARIVAVSLRFSLLPSILYIIMHKGCFSLKPYATAALLEIFTASRLLSSAFLSRLSLHSREAKASHAHCPWPMVTQRLATFDDIFIYCCDCTFDITRCSFPRRPWIICKLND